MSLAAPDEFWPGGQSLPDAEAAQDDPAAGASPSPWSPGSTAFWTAHAAGWAFFAVLGLISRMFLFGDATLAVTMTLLLDPLGFALTGFAHVLYLSRTRHRPAATVAVMLAASIAAGILLMLAAGAVKTQVFPWLPVDGPETKPLYPAAYYSTLFVVWSLIYVGSRSEAVARRDRMRRSEAEAAVARAELKRLRLQLDPHFLFNALNTIAAEIPEDPDAAIEMTRRVASYLRYSLDPQTRPICSLGEEIEAVEAYMRIQELRFGDRLRCTVAVEPDLGAVPLPHLIVQGLVENAVKHGLRRGPRSLEVRVAARRTGPETITVEVSNPGRLAPSEEGRAGLGLVNARRRLELHYPRRHELALIESAGQVTARLRLEGRPCFA